MDMMASTATGEIGRIIIATIMFVEG